MRPLRPLAALLVLAAIWLWWRAPVIRRDIARLSAAAHVALADAGLPRRGRTARPPAPQVAVAPVAAATPTAARVQRVSLRRGDSRDLSPLAPRAVPAVASTAPPPVADARDTPPASAVQASPAEEGYRALDARDRRGAAAAFRRALAETPGDPRATAWRRQLAAIERRWSGSAYLLVRRSGASDLAVAPVLGGGQGGAQLAYALDPLARRPLEVEGRVTAPTGAPGRGGQAALGLAWHPLPGTAVAVERLFALGAQARGGWTARVSGGAATAARGTRWLDASAYGEAGVVGPHDPATYAAAQGRVGRGVRLSDRLAVSAGAGVWASLQRDRDTVGRLDVGPTAAVRAGALEMRADYRLRIAGNARPGSGPALTVAAFF